MAYLSQAKNCVAQSMMIQHIICYTNFPFFGHCAECSSIFLLFRDACVCTTTTQCLILVIYPLILHCPDFCF